MTSFTPEIADIYKPGEYLRLLLNKPPVSKTIRRHNVQIDDPAQPDTRREPSLTGLMTCAETSTLLVKELLSFVLRSNGSAVPDHRHRGINPNHLSEERRPSGC
jgi:hypothetical protein